MTLPQLSEEARKFFSECGKLAKGHKGRKMTSQQGKELASKRWGKKEEKGVEK